MSNTLFKNGIKHWAAQVRAGTLSFSETTQTCIDTIKADESLGAWETIDENAAVQSAKAMDALLASGTDLGWAMGLPLAVKDIMRADGFPLTNGSNANTDHLVGPEGSVLKTFKRAGMIVIGKTKTVEFALGVTGQNTARGTPWNPCDRDAHRIPGGSSSGSAVAMAANHVGLALGTDTGGSVRIPAAFNGIVGHKTSVRLWPTDGVFSLSTTLDSIGPLCKTVDDTALVHTLMTGEEIPPPVALNGLRLGVPKEHFFDDLDPQVAEDFDRSLNALVQAGAVVVPISYPQAAERAELVPAIVPTELLSTLGVDFFNSIRNGMDTVTAQRAAPALSVTAVEYKQALMRQQELIKIANATFEHVDCWVSPTAPIVPVPYSDLENPETHKRALNASWNVQPGNLAEFCAMSLPMHNTQLPTGFQIMLPHGKDARLIAISKSIESLLNSTNGKAA